MLSSKKMDLKRDFVTGFIFLRPPPLLGFCLGWSCNFVGFESGQIQSFKLLQTMVFNRTRHPTPPSSHKLSLYTVLWQGKEGRVEPKRRLGGQQFTKLGRKYQQGWRHFALASIWLISQRFSLRKILVKKFLWKKLVYWEIIVCCT